MSAMTKKEAWSEPQFECPRCGHCCQAEVNWVGLTDEQVEGEWERITGHSIFGGDRSDGRAMYISPNEVIAFSRAIESKLYEKGETHE